MALIDDINNLPSSLKENATNHLDHHRTVHAALKDHAPRLYNAEQAASHANARATSAEATVNAHTPRVDALEAMNGVTPKTPVDGQTANLLSQPDSLTRAAASAAIHQDVISVGPTTPHGFSEGKPMLWVDTSIPVEITPPVPELGVSWARIPDVEEVSYNINGRAVPPGAQQVESGISRISAHPNDGYVINSRSEWIDNFTDAKIILDDFSGMDVGDPLAGRSTPQGDVVWGPPMGLMEGFSGSGSLVRIHTNSGSYRVGSGGANLTHNTIRAGYDDFQIDFHAHVAPSNSSTIGVNLRGTESSGDTGVAWRWRQWGSGETFRLFRRVDGVNTNIEFPKPTVGLGWYGDVSITVVGDQLTLTAQVGDIKVTDTVTYVGNPESDLIRIAAGTSSSTFSHQAYISDLAVLPL